MLILCTEILCVFVEVISNSALGQSIQKTVNSASQNPFQGFSDSVTAYNAKL